MARTLEEEARLERISEEAAKIAKEKYILPMTRIFLLVIAGILLAFGVILLIVAYPKCLIVSIVVIAVAVVLFLVRILVFRKKRNSPARNT